MTCAHVMAIGIQCPRTATVGAFCEDHAPRKAKRASRGDEDPAQRWRTPRALAQAAIREFHLDHDAAADRTNFVLPSYWSRENSALDRHWPTSLRIWDNPPFGIAEQFGTKHLTHMVRGGFSALLVLDRGSQWLERVLQVTRWWRFDGRVEYEWPPEVPRDKPGGVTFGSVLAVFDRHLEPGFMGWRDPKTFAWVRDRRGKRL